MEEENKKYKTISLDFLKEKNILIVYLNREKALNSLNEVIFEEIKQFALNFETLRLEHDIRVVILMGKGKCFSAGLDLKSNIVATIGSMQSEENGDTGRKAYKFYNSLKDWQNALTALENISVPIFAAVHSYCLGGALSITTACDFTIATKDAKFGISEVNIGIVADLGALQRMAKTTRKFGLFKKLSYTGEIFDVNVAQELGLVDYVFDDHKALYENAIKIATMIAQKSPVAVYGAKRTINFSRDYPVSTGLEMVASLNMSLIQSKDIPESVTAFLSKKKPIYPKF